MNLKNYLTVIEGEKIYLKILEEENATNEYCAWLNDYEVNKYLETREATIADLKKYIKGKLESENCLFFGIFYKENNKHIGNLKLQLAGEGKTVDYGIIIGDKDYWGRGIGTEATRLVIDFSFNFLKADSIELSVLADNQAAIKVYEKAGFRIKERKIKAVNHGGKLFDDIVMVIDNPG